MSSVISNFLYINYGDGATTGWWAVATWSNNGGAGTAYNVGDIRRSSAPTLGQERVYVCIQAGTGGTGADPLAGSHGLRVTITDAGVKWLEISGDAAMNGDLADTPDWTAVFTEGYIPSPSSDGYLATITNNARTHYFAGTTAGAATGSVEPTWNTTPGATTADGATVVWTCLGPVTNFTTAWAAPAARLSGAGNLPWGNGVFYVADNHAETGALAFNCQFFGSVLGDTTTRALCVDHTASVPPVAADLRTTAVCAASGANDVSIYGRGYIYGIIFQGGTGAVNNGCFIGQAADSDLVLENCSIQKLGTTGTASAIVFGSIGQCARRVELINTTMKFGAAADGIRMASGLFIWRDTNNPILGVMPTTLFQTSQETVGQIEVKNVDLSAMSGTIYGLINANVRAQFENCKLNQTVTLAAVPTDAGGGEATFIRCDGGARASRVERIHAFATETTETVIARVGGAYDGINAIARKIATTVNVRWETPYVALPFEVMNLTTKKDITVTVYGLYGGLTVPLNDDIWIEVVYMGDSTCPLATRKTCGKADILATGTSLTADTVSSWGGAGIRGITTAFKMQVTLTSPQVQLVGPIKVYVKAARPSSTFFIDPKVVLS